ncbi:MAG: hypothetical protein FJZ47_08365, partial [Candidatus Tectomicrobia bacterium]|nr:hypothetical protein [Candidatus Tectomicrobia bacterium]
MRTSLDHPDVTSRSALALLTLALYGLLVLPRLLSYGMFVDGVTYASLARNLAEGYGSFWQPRYTETVYPMFYEHPPLGFWLQSWAYWLWGDAWYVEALWGMLVGLLLLGSLAGLWRALVPQGMAGAWFPLLLVVLTPMTSWALANNMLETSMTLWIVLAVWLCVRSLQSPSPWCTTGYAILAGGSICAALLVKGPAALFPLVTPGIVPLEATSHLQKRALVLLILVATVVMVLLLLSVVQPAAVTFFTQYLQHQVLASVSGARETSGSRWLLLAVISREVLVPGLAATTLMVLMRRHLSVSRAAWRLCCLFLGLALAGSLPLLISAKQKRWYALPSLPFYALAIAALCHAPALHYERLLHVSRAWRRRVIMMAVGVLLVAGLWMGLEWQALRRDADFHADFSVQPCRMAARQVISVYPSTLATQWSLVANMQRTCKASLSGELGQPYLLTTREH